MWCYVLLKGQNEIVMKKTAKNKTTVIIAWGDLAMFVCPRKGKGFRLSMAGIKLEQAPYLYELKH